MGTYINADQLIVGDIFRCMMRPDTKVREVTTTRQFRSAGSFTLIEARDAAGNPASIDLLEGTRVERLHPISDTEVLDMLALAAVGVPVSALRWTDGRLYA